LLASLCDDVFRYATALTTFSPPRYTWTVLGLPRTVTDPVGTVTRNEYDSEGNLTSTIRAAGVLNQTTSWTDVLPGSSPVVRLSLFRENGHEAEAI
jgi:YD repeat-containing protein